MDKFKRVFVLAPHPDDGEFGCGATIARLMDAGTDIHYIAFSLAVKSLTPDLPKDTLRKELFASSKTLGIPAKKVHIYDFEVRTFPTYRQDILEIMINLMEKFTPNLVLIPSLHDIHQDHRTVAEEALRAFKKTTVLGYELPWNNYTFDHQVYIPVKEQYVELKARALKCYASQQHRNYANEDYIWSLAKTRGININQTYAEVFELYRWIW